MEDFGLIVSSFQAQYGIRLSREAGDLFWDEFRDLLAGLGPDTPLMRVVSVRSEEDRDILKRFTPEQRALRARWRTRMAQRKASGEVNAFLDQMKVVFARMSGGGEDRSAKK